MPSIWIIIACPVTDKEIEAEWVTVINPSYKTCHHWDVDPMYLVLSLFTGRNKESTLVHLPLFFALALAWKFRATSKLLKILL